MPLEVASLFTLPFLAIAVIAFSYFIYWLWKLGRPPEVRRPFLQDPMDEAALDGLIPASARQPILVVMSETIEDINQAAQMNQRVYYPATDEWRQVMQVRVDADGSRTVFLIDYQPNEGDVLQLVSGPVVSPPPRPASQRSMSVSVVDVLPVNAPVGTVAFLNPTNSLYRFNGNEWITMTARPNNSTDSYLNSAPVVGSKITAEPIQGAPIVGRRQMRRRVK